MRTTQHDGVATKFRITEVLRAPVHLCARLAVLGPLPKDSPSTRDTDEWVIAMTHKLIDKRRGLMDRLRRLGVPEVAGQPWTHVVNCPPIGVTTDPAPTDTCGIVQLCPFCWGRQIEETYRRFARLVFKKPEELGYETWRHFYYLAEDRQSETVPSWDLLSETSTRLQESLPPALGESGRCSARTWRACRCAKVWYVSVSHIELFDSYRDDGRMHAGLYIEQSRGTIDLRLAGRLGATLSHPEGLLRVSAQDVADYLQASRGLPLVQYTEAPAAAAPASSSPRFAPRERG